MTGRFLGGKTLIRETLYLGDLDKDMYTEITNAMCAGSAMRPPVVLGTYDNLIRLNMPWLAEVTKEMDYDQFYRDMLRSAGKEVRGLNG